MWQIPEDGTVPFPHDEPAQIPCATPPDCEAYDLMIAQAYKWDKWDYLVWSLDIANSGEQIRITGYKPKFYRAFIANLNNPGTYPKAHGTPQYEIASGNCCDIYLQPPPTL